MKPHGSSVSTSQMRAANASLAAILAAGCFYAIAAPKIESDAGADDGLTKHGPTRAMAVQSDGPSQSISPAPRSSSSSSLAADANPAVKVIGTSITTGVPCDEQTWPYIEPRCLSVADGKSSAEKAQAQNKNKATPLGLRDLLAGVKPAPSTEPANVPLRREEKVQTGGSVTAIAPTPPITDMQANSGTLASSDAPQSSTDGAASREDFGVPLPQPRPEVTLAASHPEQDAESDAASAPPRHAMSRAEYRRLGREQRRAARQLEREQRRAARELERERRRQERAEPRAPDRSRIVRRWTEYSYADDSRTIVIHQGSRRDRFFANYR